MRRIAPLRLAMLASLIFAACSAFATTVIPRQYTPPAFYGDLLLFSQVTGSKLYAIDRATKKDVWVWSSGGRNVRTTPTVDGDVAYIWAGTSSTDTSRACAIDCRTGLSIWETPAAGWTFERARLVENVVLFPVENNTDEIHAFDRATGRNLWIKEDSDLLLVHGKDVLVSRESDRKLVVLDAVTGAEVFSCPFSSANWAYPQADCNDAGIAVAGCDGTVIAVDIPKRTELWRVGTGKKRLIPALAGDSLFLITGWSDGNNDGGQALEKWNLASGVRETTVEIKAGCRAFERPFVFDSVITVATDGQLIGVERETGKEIWRAPIGGSSRTCQTSDSVYVGEIVSLLVQFEASTGKILWRYEVDRPQDVELNPPGSEVSECHRTPLIGRYRTTILASLSAFGFALAIVVMLIWRKR